jgi:hypothetical protein
MWPCLQYHHQLSCVSQWNVFQLGLDFFLTAATLSLPFYPVYMVFQNEV